MRLPLSEVVAGAAALAVGITSFTDGWAYLELRGGGVLTFSEGARGFDAYTGYPMAVGAAIAGAFLYVGVIVGRAVGNTSRNNRLDVAISLGTLVLLLYGIWEGPSGLSDGAFVAGAEGSFTIERGPSLYVATAAAAAMFAASAISLRARDKPNG